MADTGAEVLAAAPIETVRVVPVPFDATTGVQVEPVLREDMPGVTYEYRWFLNGEEIETEDTNHFPGALLKRGDQLSVEIIPVAFGGEKLPPFVSLPLEAENASPEILSQPPESLGERGFSYHVKAVDPDGDGLTFSLAEGPQGMQINGQTGFLRWDFVQMPEGIFPVRIIVEDGYGGRAEQYFELNMALITKENGP